MRLATRNLASSYGLYGASVLSGLVLTPIIISSVGQEGYGAWVFIISATTLLRLIDFGITPTVVRFTAFHRGRGEDDEIDTLASTSLGVFLVLGVVSLAAGLLLAWLLPELITLSAGLRREAQVAAVLAVLTLALQAPLGLFGSLLKGAQRFDVINMGGLLSIGVYALLVLAVVTRFETLPVLAASALAASVVLLGYPLLFVRREFPRLRLSRALVSRSSLRGLLGFSGFAFLGHAAAKVVFSSDVIVIGLILGARQVALYGVAMRLFSFATGVAAIGTSLLLPMQSELHGRGEHERQRAYLAAGMRGTTCVAVLLGFPLLILPSWILDAWLGAGFGASVVPLALLGAAAAFTTANGVLSQFLFARGRPGIVAGALSVLALVNLALTITLLLAREEIAAAALATLIVEACSACVVLPLLVRRNGIPLRLLAGAWSAPMLVGIVAALPTLVLARAVTDTDSLLLLAAVGAAWAAVFAVLAWPLALTDVERAIVRRLLSRRDTPPAAA